ncbi:MAG: Holliday junction branch migration protein RuvA [Lactobacillales bacterium]|jgi:Holliday junction DNA helicase RuvA|nr:Holliday junction branch migration protein RuvA [Lactobacillales bacterium]
MYEYLKGKIEEITPYYLVIEVNGIGFQLLSANPYSFSEKVGEATKIYIYQVVREDSHTLYGFHTRDEKLLFLKLISVSGIGPKSALAILANEDEEGIVMAIEQSDVSYLTKFPGVGKKTASQMILDLQGKLEDLLNISTSNSLSMSSEKSEKSKKRTEALEALSALGYASKDVKRVEKELRDVSCQTADQYLRHALKLL